MFKGRPLISYPIELALSSGLFHEVIVSTDDEEIAEVAKRAGASIPFRRPDHLADDATATVPVIQHALQEMERLGSSFDAALCLYPACVLMSPVDLHRSLEVLKSALDAQYTSVVVKYGHPIQRALRERGDGLFELIHPESGAARTQDLEPCWHDAGQFYWGWTNAWTSAVPILSSTAGYRVPEWRVQDIDTQDDWVRAELLAELIERYPETGPPE